MLLRHIPEGSQTLPIGWLPRVRANHVNENYVGAKICCLVLCNGKVQVDVVWDIQHIGLRNYRPPSAAVMQDDQLMSGYLG